MKWDVLQNDLIDEARHRVQVTREDVAPESQAFERDGPTAGKRVNQDRRFWVSRFDELSCSLQINWGMCVVPIAQVADELEKRVPQILWLRLGGMKVSDKCPRFGCKVGRTERVAGIR